jgi:cbb3-type cytochrome oxidase cytochrome c subunit
VQADQGLESPLFDPRIHAIAEDLKDVENPGQYRKVGPSLRHVAEKTTQGWLEHWTMEPKAFRPSTRMPQFFHLTNQDDATAEAYQPVQVSAIGHYLLAKSQEVELLTPEKGYQPNAERGKELFARRGCLACHSKRR